jgi:TolB-like protein
MSEFVQISLSEAGVSEETGARDTGTGSSGAGIEPAAALSTSGDQVSPLWRRLKEHRIAQWSLGYIAVAYGIQHAVVLTTESLDWPHIVTRVSMLLLALGLPFAVTFAWYHGARANHRISGPELTIISILLVGISLLFYVFIRPSERIAEHPVTATPAMTVTAPAAKPASMSVAVLPFLNLSGDPKEEFFSDGMTEEITAALANVKGLNVVARTSAFAFKGKNEDIIAIGRALHATDIIEGSVRKEGDQVRITAQLIRADTGDHLWTDSYDRELKDVFAVQEDIARAIAAALQVPLGLQQGENLVSSRDIDPESYQNYLRGEALFRSRERGTPLTTTIALLEQVVARQPNYAPAWARLAQAYALAPNFDSASLKGSVQELRRLVNEARPKAKAAAQRAIQLDPHNADAYAALGQIQGYSNKRLDAEQSFKRALSLDPMNSLTLELYSLFLAQNGRMKQAVGMREQLRSLEPLVPAFNTATSTMLLAAGEKARALAIAEALPSGYSVRPAIIARNYASLGRYKEAADAVLQVRPGLFPLGAVENAARLLRLGPSPATLENIPDLGGFDWVFAYVGLPERALEFDEHVTDAGYWNAAFPIVWSSDFAAVRKTDRFKALVRKMGLIDYWRATGWPPFCHPTAGDDFACN